MDLDEKVWRMSSYSMKMSKDHEVPLSSRRGIDTNANILRSRITYSLYELSVISRKIIDIRSSISHR